MHLPVQRGKLVIGHYWFESMIARLARKAVLYSKFYRFRRSEMSTTPFWTVRQACWANWSYTILAEYVPVTGTSYYVSLLFLESQDLQNYLIEAVSMANELSGSFLVNYFIVTVIYFFVLYLSSFLKVEICKTNWLKLFPWQLSFQARS